MEPASLFNISASGTAVGAVGAIFAAIAAFKDATKPVQLSMLIVSLGGIGTVATTHLYARVEDPCATAPALLLNEVCAEGDECGTSNDFVELYNPSDQEADMACYGLVDMFERNGQPTWRRNPTLLDGGPLPPRGVRAFSEAELGFKIEHANGDGVRLVRLVSAGPFGYQSAVIDHRSEINGGTSYWYRVPNGAQWRSLPHERQHDITRVQTFSEDNPNYDNAASR